VAQYHVIGRQIAELCASREHHVELPRRHVARHRLADLGQVDGQYSPRWPHFSTRIQRPGAGRRSQIEHALTGAKQAVAALDFLQLEHAARRIARRLGSAREAIGLRIVLRLTAHSTWASTLLVPLTPGSVAAAQPPTQFSTPPARPLAASACRTSPLRSR